MTAPRVAIVTGAGRGIGAATALRLARDGHSVVVLDLTEEACAATVEQVTAAGGTAVGVGADVSDEAAVAAAFVTIESTLGAPTILVNNAGIIRDNLLFKLETADWDAVMNVHLRGAFLMSRAAQSYMVRERFGRIVNMSSSSALGNRGQANYASAKAGIQGFTKTLAIELGRFGITVNSVAPGWIQTDMTAATAARLGVSFDELIEQWASQIPVGRVGQPDDVASAVSYFVSEESGFVSGQVLYVAGGPLG